MLGARDVIRTQVFSFRFSDLPFLACMALSRSQNSYQSSRHFIWVPARKKEGKGHRLFLAKSILFHQECKSFPEATLRRLLFTSHWSKLGHIVTPGPITNLNRFELFLPLGACLL